MQMNKTLIIKRFIPAKSSSTSDCRMGFYAETAETGNLAAIMKNNTILFKSILPLASYNVERIVKHSVEKIK